MARVSKSLCRSSRAAAAAGVGSETSDSIPQFNIPKTMRDIRCEAKGRCKAKCQHDINPYVPLAAHMIHAHMFWDWGSCNKYLHASAVCTASMCCGVYCKYYWAHAVAEINTDFKSLSVFLGFLVWEKRRVHHVAQPGYETMLPWRPLPVIVCLLWSLWARECLLF